MIAAGTATLDRMRKADIDHFATHCADGGELLRVFRKMINHLFPVTHAAADPTKASRDEAAEVIRAENEASKKAITIMGDKEIPYRLLRKVMVTCARADFTDVAFAVQQKGG